MLRTLVQDRLATLTRNYIHDLDAAIWTRTQQYNEDVAALKAPIEQLLAGSHNPAKAATVVANLGAAARRASQAIRTSCTKATRKLLSSVDAIQEDITALSYYDM